MSEDRVSQDHVGQELAVMLAEVTKTLVSLSEMTSPIRDAVEGYRAQMERDGYGDGLARQMAADYHGGLIRMMLR